MTEIEWLSCPNPKVMLEFLRGNTSERKLRLFAVVCRREYLRFRPDIPADSLTSKYADITELYVDGEVTIKEWDEVRECIHGTFHHPDAYNHATGEIHTATCCCYTDESTRDAEERVELAFLASIIHDIFGNPFRPLVVDARWRTPTAVALATGIYSERAFDRMPILADALQDAGCDHADILDHCRSNVPHVRGCWVVDLLLGKS
jgi:hypothetical protein